MVALVPDDKGLPVKHLLKPLVLHIHEEGEELFKFLQDWFDKNSEGILTDVDRKVIKWNKDRMVHEADIIEHYPLLKEYLTRFAGDEYGLPDLEHHKAAMALLAVDKNLFPAELYLKKGGKGKEWADTEAAKFRSLPAHVVRLTHRTVNARHPKIAVLKKIVAHARGLTAKARCYEPKFQQQLSSDTINMEDLPEDPLECSVKKNPKWPPTPAFGDRKGDEEDEEEEEKVIDKGPLVDPKTSQAEKEKGGKVAAAAPKKPGFQDRDPLIDPDKKVRLDAKGEIAPRDFSAVANQQSKLRSAAKEEKKEKEFDKMAKKRERAAKAKAKREQEGEGEVAAPRRGRPPKVAAAKEGDETMTEGHPTKRPRRKAPTKVQDDTLAEASSSSNKRPCQTPMKLSKLARSVATPRPPTPPDAAKKSLEPKQLEQPEKPTGPTEAQKKRKDRAQLGLKKLVDNLHEVALRDVCFPGLAYDKLSYTALNATGCRIGVYLYTESFYVYKDALVPAKLSEATGLQVDKKGGCTIGWARFPTILDAWYAAKLIGKWVGEDTHEAKEVLKAFRIEA